MRVSERGYRRAILAVAVASLLLSLPFLGALPLFDPDEAFYPAAAAESLDHGHPLDLTLNGEPRWNKPPLAYALIQGSFLALGRSEFAARLPSAIEGAALVAILGLAVAAAAGGRAGLLAAVILASTLGHQVMGRAAHPEMALVLGTAAAQILLALWFVSHNDTRRRWMPWAAGVAMGFGFLAKGPVALAMPALLLLAGMLLVPRGERPSWPAAGRVFGGAALLACALAAPWFLWMGARHGGAFWGTALGQLGHYTADDYEHAGNHPLYFVPVLVGGLFPWVVLLPGALRGLRRRAPSPAARLRLLLALAAGTSFLFWSFSTSKLPGYGLVFLPPLSGLLGIHLAGPAPEGGRPPLGERPRTAVLVLAVLFLALAVLPGILLSSGSVPFGSEVLQAPRLGALALGLLLFLLLAGVSVLRSPAPSLAAVALAGVLPVLVAIPTAVPVDAELRPFREAAGMVTLLEKGRPPAPLAVYRRRLPSLSFYTGRKVAWPHTLQELSEFLDAPGERWLLIRERHLRALGDLPRRHVDGSRPLPGDWRLLRFER